MARVVWYGQDSMAPDAYGSMYIARMSIVKFTLRADC